jgi:hypothetical protein
MKIKCIDVGLRDIEKPLIIEVLPEHEEVVKTWIRGLNIQGVGWRMFDDDLITIEEAYRLPEIDYATLRGLDFIPINKIYYKWEIVSETNMS